MTRAKFSWGEETAGCRTRREYILDSHVYEACPFLEFNVATTRLSPCLLPPLSHSLRDSIERNYLFAIGSIFPAASSPLAPQDVAFSVLTFAISL